MSKKWTSKDEKKYQSVRRVVQFGGGVFYFVFMATRYVNGGQTSQIILFFVVLPLIIMAIDIVIEIVEFRGNKKDDIKHVELKSDDFEKSPYDMDIKKEYTDYNKGTNPYTMREEVYSEYNSHVGYFSNGEKIPEFDGNGNRICGKCGKIFPRFDKCCPQCGLMVGIIRYDDK